jgi:hypothetical protein|nr:hypothetical protein [uncultured bacterium]
MKYLITLSIAACILVLAAFFLPSTFALINPGTGTAASLETEMETANISTVYNVTSIEYAGDQIIFRVEPVL